MTVRLTKAKREGVCEHLQLAENPGAELSQWSPGTASHKGCLPKAPPKHAEGDMLKGDVLHP